MALNLSSSVLLPLAPLSQHCLCLTHHRITTDPMKEHLQQFEKTAYWQQQLSRVPKIGQLSRVPKIVQLLPPELPSTSPLRFFSFPERGLSVKGPIVLLAFALFLTGSSRGLSGTAQLRPFISYSVQ